MPLYIYKALTPEGRELTREAAASSEEELRLELRNQGLLLQTVRKKGVSFITPGGQKAKPEDFLQYNQELTTLLKAGLTVPEALGLCLDRPENRVLSATLKKILQDIKGGSLFSAACAGYPRLFDGLYLSSLKTGERTGNLAEPLRRYQDYLRQKIALQNKVSQAMVYPLFLLGVLGGVMTLLFAFVMPRFAALYSNFNAALPWPTQVLMTIVHHLPLAAALAAGGALALWGGVQAWVSYGRGRLWLDEAKQRLPLLGRFTRPFLVSQFTRTLSTLISGGTPMTEALRVAQQALPNRAFALRLEKVIARVFEGESLSKALGAERVLPPADAKLVEVGEASGQLEQMLAEIAHSNEYALENRVQRALALVEPLFILLAGLLIGTVIVVMYLPIIHLTDIVK